MDDKNGVRQQLSAFQLDDGTDPSTIAFAGDSAGGGLTVATCLAARDAGLPGTRPCGTLPPPAHLMNTRRESHLNKLKKCGRRWGFVAGRHRGEQLAAYEEFQLTIDNTARKTILWESDNATDAEVRAMEAQLIREHRSNDPVIGYNLWPKL